MVLWKDLPVCAKTKTKKKDFGAAGSPLSENKLNILINLRG